MSGEYAESILNCWWRIRRTGRDHVGGGHGGGGGSGIERRHRGASVALGVGKPRRQTLWAGVRGLGNNRRIPPVLGCEQICDSLRANEQICDSLRANELVNPSRRQSRAAAAAAGGPLLWAAYLIVPANHSCHHACFSALPHLLCHSATSSHPIPAPPGSATGKLSNVEQGEICAGEGGGACLQGGRGLRGRRRPSGGCLAR